MIHFTILAFMCLLLYILSVQAGNLAANDYCNVNATVSCTLDRDGSDCNNPLQTPSTCGETNVTFKYEFCNTLHNESVMLLEKAPLSGENGTVAMFREVYGKPVLPMTPIRPGVCKVAFAKDTVDTCNKNKTVGDLKIEGW